MIKKIGEDEYEVDPIDYNMLKPPKTVEEWDRAYKNLKREYGALAICFKGVNARLRFYKTGYKDAMKRLNACHQQRVDDAGSLWWPLTIVAAISASLGIISGIIIGGLI